MGKKQQKLKAAHARISRWPNLTQRGSATSCGKATGRNEDSARPVEETSAAAPAEDNELTPDMDDGYTGGVNHNPDNDHSDGCMELLDSDGDAESLCELDGDDLEKNLAALRLSEGGLTESTCTNNWSQIFGKISKEQWEKAESNRALGYNGQSKRSKRRKEKEARERADVNEKMKSS